MKTKINNPKVFISYAWSSDEYIQKVIAFAESLMYCGIDVLLDKWDLNEGNDTYVYMEKCVNDKSVTNVLMLLDKKYQEKADERKGGVGTETQIISAELYNNVAQSKFIPIIFDKGDKGEVYRPTFVKTLLYFDLADESTYDNEFQRLVRTLFGQDTYVKPQLGTKPAWVDVVSIKNVNIYNDYKMLENTQLSQHSRKSKLDMMLDNILNNIYSMDFAIEHTLRNLLTLSDRTLPIKDEYLEVLKHALDIDDFDDSLINFYEKASKYARELAQKSDYAQDVMSMFMYETFVSSVAVLYKFGYYKEIYNLTNRRYYYVRNEEVICSSFEEAVQLQDGYNYDRAIDERDGKSYISGFSVYLLERINNKLFSREEFVFADILLCNIGCIKRAYWPWFPSTYIAKSNLFKEFCIRLKSVTQYEKFQPLFGMTIDDFKKSCKEMENKKTHYRHEKSIQDVPFIIDYVKIEEIGSMG